MASAVVRVVAEQLCVGYCLRSCCVHASVVSATTRHTPYLRVLRKFPVCFGVLGGTLTYILRLVAGSIPTGCATRTAPLRGCSGREPPLDGRTATEYGDSGDRRTKLGECGRDVGSGGRACCCKKFKKFVCQVARVPHLGSRDEDPATHPPPHRTPSFICTTTHLLHSPWLNPARLCTWSLRTRSSQNVGAGCTWCTV